MQMISLRPLMIGPHPGNAHTAVLVEANGIGNFDRVLRVRVPSSSASCGVIGNCLNQPARRRKCRSVHWTKAVEIFMKSPSAMGMTPEQAEWFDATQIQKPEWVNPMVRKFGVDPERRTCKGCDWLLVNECSKRYYKCRLRGVTSGPGTDHRVSWPACSKFTPFKPRNICGSPSTELLSPASNG